MSSPLDNRGKFFCEVDAVAFFEAERHWTSLLDKKMTIDATFDLENPFASDDFGIMK